LNKFMRSLRIAFRAWHSLNFHLVGVGTAGIYMVVKIRNFRLTIVSVEALS
jgi:hypothetical protein